MEKFQCKNIVATNISDNLSRRNLLFWIESQDCTGRKITTKVEQLCSGVVYCQLMNHLFPGCISLKKVKLNAYQVHEYIHNLKLLQQAFASVDCNKVIYIDKLVQGKFQENLQFLQWFKLFYDANKELKSKKGETSSIFGHPIPAFGACSSNHSEIAELQSSVNKLQDTSDQISKERDFYFSKMKKIENLCMKRLESEAHNSSENSADEPSSIQQLITPILHKLYETNEEFLTSRESDDDAC